MIDKEDYCFRIIEKLESQYILDGIEFDYLEKTINEVLDETIQDNSGKEIDDWDMFNYDIYLKVISRLGLED